jgi:hypothetical protein
LAYQPIHDLGRKVNETTALGGAAAAALRSAFNHWIKAGHRQE